MRVMLDTNAFNRVLDRDLNGLLLPRVEYFCTNLQHAEILRTKDPERLSRLLEVFVNIKATRAVDLIEQRSTPWNSPWGSPWDQGGKYYAPIMAALEQDKPRSRGNSYDAVLIETCKYEGLVFVSEDQSARDVAKTFGVEAINFEQFLAAR